MHSENTARADFDAAYAVSPGDDSVAATDETLITRPAPRSSICGSSASVSWIGREVVDLGDAIDGRGVGGGDVATLRDAGVVHEDVDATHLVEGRARARRPAPGSARSVIHW